MDKGEACHIRAMREVIRCGTIQDVLDFKRSTEQVVEISTTLSKVIQLNRRSKDIMINDIRTMAYFNK